MIDAPLEKQPSLAARFFNEVRDVSVGVKAMVDFDPADLVRIAEDPAQSAEFRKLFSTGVNDPNLKNLIVEILEIMAAKIGESAKLQAVDAGLIEKFGLVPPAAALSVALGTILHGVTNPVGAIVALTVAGLGIAGICIAGLGTRVMKRREVLSESDSRKIARLIRSLKDAT